MSMSRIHPRWVGLFKARVRNELATLHIICSRFSLSLTRFSRNISGDGDSAVDIAGDSSGDCDTIR
jgi:hypothetical protein